MNEDKPKVRHTVPYVPVKRYTFRDALRDLRQNPTYLMWLCSLRPLGVVAAVKCAWKFWKLTRYTSDCDKERREVEAWFARMNDYSKNDGKHSADSGRES